MRYLAIAFSLWIVAAGSCRAEDYPDRPVHMVVPTGPGGITDVLARLISEQLARSTGYPVLVENRAGAGGVAGTDYVANAAPDGYTLLFAFPSHAVNAALYKRLPYDAVEGFEPVTMVSRFPAVLEVRPDFPAATIEALIILAQSKTNPLNYASVGNGSLAFLAAELFAQSTNIKLVQAPYTSVPEADNAVLSGEVDLFFDTPVTAIPLLRAGKVRALGVTSKSRQPALPDVPSISETIPGYEVLGWNGVLAPKGTPSEVVEQLNRLIVDALRTPRMQREFAADGVQSVGDSPGQFRQAIQADIEKWSALIRELGIQPE